MMKIIKTSDSNFKEEFENILGRSKSDIKEVSTIVTNIIDEIVEDGNEALKAHIKKNLINGKLNQMMIY